MAHVTIGEIIWAFFGGLAPSLVWLIFWLREDKKNPEPKGRILFTFALGMLCVLLVLPFQKGVEYMLGGVTVMSVFLWAAFEELFKFGAGYLGGLHSEDDNEAVDPLIYMLTAALGFTALENALFILGPLIGHDLTQGLITGNMRFIGANLLHVVSSGMVGLALSLTFYKSKSCRTIAAFSALMGAILFHTLFNLLIIAKGDSGTTLAFLLVWLGVMILLLAFEKVKGLARRNSLV